MRGRLLTIAAVAVAAVGCGVAGALAGDKPPAQEVEPFLPTVEIISPRNGAVQTARAVVVKSKVGNFQLAPRHFGKEPELGMGNLRFSLNRVPDCVDPAKLQIAEESPIGRGRLVGASFDFPHYSGPNGLLASKIGSTGSYSPATRPEIYYHHLRPGLYRLVVTLAENNGATTPYHDVTNFQILPRPGSPGPKPCPKGKISSAKASGLIR
ncbi:MAG TPA: hypothetical protein VHQ97_03310 [Solirubrobacterales bacterium]|jgi:hypothetical protein|nr:hypothetical protein [Solirubrobacterales bacterium]